MKKFFCLVVAFVLIVSAVSVTSFAYSEKSHEITELISVYDAFGEGDMPLIFDNVSPYYYNAYEGKPVYSAYSLLDNCQKKMYNYFVNAPLGTLLIKMEFEQNEFLSENFNQTYLSEVMYAVLRDRPEIFYFNGYSVTGGYYYSDYASIANMDISISLKSNSTYTANNLPGFCSALQNTLKNVPVDTSNRYNFVKSVHDYLCASAYYPDLNSSDYIGNAHDAYGALVEGRTVCEGYSEAFKLICNYYNIPSVCITGLGNGGAHMWNAVQMDDGKWYLLDITWDDQEDWTFYDFFLVGLNTKDYYFGGEAFNESHEPDDSSYLPVLNYSAEKYSETNHFTEFKATYNSLAKVDAKCLIRSVFDVQDCNVYYNGMYVPVENVATNSKFSVACSESNESEIWTMVLLGDSNSDGLSNANDFSECVNKVLSGKEVTDASDMALDIDCDGYLDVLDISAMQIITSGIDTNIVIE